MRVYIEANLKVIRKYLKKRKQYSSKLNNASIMEEFKEWSKDPLPETESIWTLPDLTRNERLKNFCRSIKNTLSYNIKNFHNIFNAKYKKYYQFIKN